jgi:hypothetical protein
MALAAGCGSDNKPTVTAPPVQAEAPGAADEPAGEQAAASDKVKVIEGKAPGKDDRYALEIESPDAKAGQESKVTVRVVPRDPWHMNLDFPTSLALQAPQGVSLAKAELKKADAAKLDEASCQFDVAFTPTQPGSQSITGKFKFAVCQDEACSPVTEDVEFKVAVK